MSISRKKHLKFNQSHAIVIGIDNYELGEGHLHNPVNDAKDIHQLLISEQGFDNVLFWENPDLSHLHGLMNWLLDKERAKNEHLPFLQQIKDTKKGGSQKPGSKFKSTLKRRDQSSAEKPWHIDPENDSLLIYFAGHGLPGQSGENTAGFLAASDSDLTITGKNLPMDTLYQALQALGCRHTLVILDCCFAGSFRQARSRFKIGTEVPAMDKPRFFHYRSSKAWQVLASCGPGQEANDAARWAEIRRNSPFAATLKSALSGAADFNKDGAITAAEIAMHVREKVVEIVAGNSQPQVPEIIHMPEHRGGEFLFLKQDFELGKLKDRKVQNPYKGLLPYTYKDHRWYFGREDEVREMLLKFLNLPMVIVSGNSAVGKSSFIQAGIFPALEQQFKVGKEACQLLVLRPGAKPWSGKPVHIHSNNNEGGEIQELSYHTGLKELCLGRMAKGGKVPKKPEEICGLLDPRKNNQKVLILIDQYESLFAALGNAKHGNEADKKEIEQFTQGLLELYTLAMGSGTNTEGEAFAKIGGLLRIAITIRSDVEWRLEEQLAHQLFQLKHGRKPKENVADANLIEKGFSKHVFRLGPMNPVQLQRALVEPAYEEFFEFEAGLVEQILEDINDSPAALPLMSFTMQKLTDLTMQKWNKEHGDKEENEAFGNKEGDVKRVFTQELYADPHKGLGGIVGALRREANHLYEELGKDKKVGDKLQATLQKIVLRLSQDRSTRRKVYHRSGADPEQWSELDYAKDEQDARVNTVLDTMEKAQLIVRGLEVERGQEYIELAHDSLVTNWPACQQWIDERGDEYLKLQVQLWEAVLENKGPAKKEEERPHQNNLPAGAEAVAIGFSHNWRDNPKLLQVIEYVTESAKAYINTHRIKIRNQSLKGLPEGEEKEKIKNIWVDCGRTGKIPDINSLVISGFSGPLLEICLEHGNHWLNQKEIEFVLQSWNERVLEIMNLKKERDEAIRAKEIAEQKTRETQAAALAAKARQIADQEPTLTFNLAVAAYNTFPSQEATEARRDFWQPQKTYRQLFRHEKAIIDIAVSPKGSMLLTSGWDYMAKLWDIDTGELLQSFGPLRWFPGFVAFYPDEKKVLVASPEEGLAVFDISTGEEIPMLHIPSVYNESESREVLSLGISPNGENLFIYSSEELITTYDANTLKTKVRLKIPKSIADPKNARPTFGLDLRRLVFSPDGKTVLVGVGDRVIKLLDLASGKVLQEFIGHSGGLIAAAFSHEGTRILTGSKDTTAKVWDIATGKVIQSFVGHTDEVWSVAFVKDGKRIITGSKDKSMRMWDAATGTYLRDFIGNVDTVHKLISSPVANHVFSGSKDSGVRLWDLDARQEYVNLVSRRKPSQSSVYGICFSPDSKYIWANIMDNRAGTPITKAWALDTHKEIQSFVAERNSRDLICFRPDGKVWLMTVNFTAKSTKLWEADTGKEILRLQGKECAFRPPFFSPDGRYMAMAVVWDNRRIYQNRVVLWDATTLERIQTFTGFMQSAGGMYFSSDNTQLLIASQEGTIIHWDVQSKKERLRRENFFNSISSATFTPDGKHILTSELGHSVLRDLSTGSKVMRFEGRGPRMSSDGKRVLTISKGHVIKLWDSETGIGLKNFEEPINNVSSFAFSPDGRKIASGSKDGTLKLWDTSMNWPEHSYKLNAEERKKYGIEVAY